MTERRVNGIYDGQAEAPALGGPRRYRESSPAAVGPAERTAEATLQSLRTGRNPVRPRPRELRSRAISQVLVGEREHRLYLLAPGEIDYVESRGNYVEFHANQLVFISRDSIKRLSRELADCGYVRIQRTLLLNIQSILYAQRDGHGTYAFTLCSGARLRSGARYREEILRTLPLTRARRLDGS